MMMNRDVVVFWCLRMDADDAGCGSMTSDAEAVVWLWVWLWCAVVVCQ